MDGAVADSTGSCNSTATTSAGDLRQTAHQTTPRQTTLTSCLQPFFTEQGCHSWNDYRRASGGCRPRLRDNEPITHWQQVASSSEDKDGQPEAGSDSFAAVAPSVGLDAEVIGKPSDQGVQTASATSAAAPPAAGAARSDTCCINGRHLRGSSVEGSVLRVCPSRLVAPQPQAKVGGSRLCLAKSSPVSCKGIVAARPRLAETLRKAAPCCSSERNLRRNESEVGHTAEEDDAFSEQDQAPAVADVSTETLEHRDVGSADACHLEEEQVEMLELVADEGISADVVDNIGVKEVEEGATASWCLTPLGDAEEGSAYYFSEHNKLGKLDLTARQEQVPATAAVAEVRHLAIGKLGGDVAVAEAIGTRCSKMPNIGATQAATAEAAKTNLNRKDAALNSEKGWADMTAGEKACAAFITSLKISAVLGMLYLLIVCLIVVGSNFKVLAGPAAARVSRHRYVFANPIAFLLLGALATALLQLSSASASTVKLATVLWLLPGTLLLLYLIHWGVLLAFLLLVVPVGMVALIIPVLRERCPNSLPSWLLKDHGELRYSIIPRWILLRPMREFAGTAAPLTGEVQGQPAALAPSASESESLWPLVWGPKWLAMSLLLLTVFNAKWADIKYAPRHDNRLDFSIGAYKTCSKAFAEEGRWAQPPVDAASCREWFSTCSAVFSANCTREPGFADVDGQDEAYWKLMISCTEKCSLADWQSSCVSLACTGAKHEEQCNNISKQAARAYSLQYVTDDPDGPWAGGQECREPLQLCDNDGDIRDCGNLAVAGMVLLFLSQLLLFLLGLLCNAGARSERLSLAIVVAVDSLAWLLLLASWVHFVVARGCEASCIVAVPGNHGYVIAKGTFTSITNSAGSYIFYVTLFCWIVMSFVIVATAVRLAMMSLLLQSGSKPSQT